MKYFAFLHHLLNIFKIINVLARQSTCTVSCYCCTNMGTIWSPHQFDIIAWCTNSRKYNKRFLYVSKEVCLSGWIDLSWKKRLKPVQCLWNAGAYIKVLNEWIQMSLYFKVKAQEYSFGNHKKQCYCSYYSQSFRNVKTIHTRSVECSSLVNLFHCNILIKPPMYTLVCAQSCF